MRQEEEGETERRRQKGEGPDFKTLYPWTVVLKLSDKWVFPGVLFNKLDLWSLIHQRTGAGLWTQGPHFEKSSRTFLSLREIVRLYKSNVAKSGRIMVIFPHQLIWAARKSCCQLWHLILVWESEVALSGKVPNTSLRMCRSFSTHPWLKPHPVPLQTDTQSGHPGGHGLSCWDQCWASFKRHVREVIMK